MLEGKSAGLNKKDYAIIRLFGNLIGFPFFIVINPVLTILASVMVIVMMLYAYLNFDVKYNPVIHFVWAIYFCFVISQIVPTLVLTFGMFIALALHFKFRFKNVNRMIKTNKMTKIAKAIKKHKKICCDVEEVNKITTNYLITFYFAITFALDIALYLSLYGDNTLIRIVMVNCSCCILFGIFAAYCSSAIFISEAHKPYKIIMSLIAKKRFRVKWKVSLIDLIF